MTGRETAGATCLSFSFPIPSTRYVLGQGDSCSTDAVGRLGDNERELQGRTVHQAQLRWFGRRARVEVHAFTARAEPHQRHAALLFM